MNELIKYGNIYPGNGQAGWIYNIKGICPALVTMTNGAGKEPKVIVRIKDEQRRN